jgi:hypothetical protein
LGLFPGPDPFGVAPGGGTQLRLRVEASGPGRGNQAEQPVPQLGARITAVGPGVSQFRRDDGPVGPALQLGGQGQGGTSSVINLGTGTGTTVRELLDAFNQVADRPVKSVDVSRRPGDVAGTYTRSDRAQRCLSWKPRYSIAEGIRHSLDWAAIRDRILA